LSYNVYVACDRCGEDPFAWKNQTVTISRAKRIVKSAGWHVRKDGAWYCSECWETIRRAETIVYGEVVE
jgi:hypothetical protein